MLCERNEGEADSCDKDQYHPQIHYNTRSLTLPVMQG
jgi:hypothetical protein